MKVQHFLMILALVTVFSACKKKPQPGYSVVKTDQIFEMKMGQSVVVDGQDLKLTFSAVPEDSRCPEGANCIQEGQIRIVLATVGDNASREIEFTRKATFKGTTTQTLGKFKIQLNEVSPYPKSGTPVQPEQYKLKLAVRKIG